MNSISFKILPSSDSNDHEVRILIDGNDILGDDYLGIDPPAFFTQPNLVQTGKLLIGRCTCGCEGCGDYPVNVNILANKVSWTDHNGLILEFDKTNYEKVITQAQGDHSWEDIKRRVERLTSDLLNNTKTSDDYKFDWTSARIKENTITLSYSKGIEQKVFEFKWDGQTDNSAVTSAQAFIKREAKIASTN